MFHVDGVKASHKEKNVGYKFEQCIDFMYIKPNTVKVKSVRGKVHEYLSMTLDYTKKGEVKIDMGEYVKDMIDELLITFKNPRH